LQLFFVALTTKYQIVIRIAKMQKKAKADKYNNKKNMV
jgi:hypothetical protein